MFSTPGMAGRVQPCMAMAAAGHGPSSQLQPCISMGMADAMPGMGGGPAAGPGGGAAVVRASSELPTPITRIRLCISMLDSQPPVLYPRDIDVLVLFTRHRAALCMIFGYP
eukprot:SAG31_NODE_3486_length_4210_cov_1.754074_1_plen_111_part_00